MSQKLNVLFVFTLVVMLACSACGYGDSFVRQSTLAPTAHGGTAVQPLDKGELDVAGSVSTVNVRQHIPKIGGSDVHVAHTNAHAYLRYGFTENLAFGIQGQYAHRSLSHPQSQGTPPLTRPSAFGLGPMMTVRFDIHERVSLNLMGSVSVLSTPWAQWGVSCGDDEWCEEPEGGTYRYMKSGKSNVGLYRLQLGPYFQVTNQFAAFAGASLQNSVGNIALHNDSSSRTDLFGDPFVDGSYNYAVGYAGVAYQHHSGFYLQGQVFVSNDERTSPTGGQLTLGLQL